MKALRPYAFVKAGRAGRLMDRVAAAIAQDGQALTLLAHPKAQVMSDIKLRLKSSGSVAIKALYWSVRCPDPSAWGGLRARTLLGDDDQLIWVDLPDDPALPALASLSSQAGAWQVLRYVPLRRATLMYRPSGGAMRIVKVKRPDRACDAARRLAAVNAALGNAAPFATPQLLGSAPDGTFALSVCPGAPVGTALFHQIGRMHAALHACPTPVMNAGLPVEHADTGTIDLSLIAALRPDLAPRLGPLAQTLRNMPAVGRAVLCHGDLGLDQILQQNGALSLVDFDRSHLGEAAADIAHFLLAIPPEAEAPYLVGYSQIRPLPDPDLLHWFRCRNLVARLLVSLRKDQPDQTDHLLQRLHAPVPA
ncbi:MAG: aminoglycoside phosphotransferase family protein [Rhodobacteraceae bacterium]|jgi:hypothetical protein|nr:aminoglycoside phosphotransferase family protein [Paracoccaceae bacterium]